MKKIVTNIAAAFIMIASLSSFAAEKIDPSKYEESSRVVITYLEATTLGSVDLNTSLFADDFQYSNSIDGRTHNKKQYVAFLNSNKGLIYNCEKSYEILDQTGRTSIAKATLVFEGFTRVDYITLSQSEEGWKVSKVVTTYP